MPATVEDAMGLASARRPDSPLLVWWVGGVAPPHARGGGGELF